MKTQAEVESWEIVSKRAYWDRNVSMEKWKAGVAAGRISYLPSAVQGMEAAEFVHFYGVKDFVQDWPVLRAKLPENIRRNARVYDIVWSQLAGGGWNLTPAADFHDMPKRRREFLAAVAKTPGRNIYRIAKALKMQYRRAHEHAASLIQDGKIRGLDVAEDGRQQTRLYPAYDNPPKRRPSL